mmetsp:Transcript_6502/g.26346  ORF Transcript_6502/g.26346 Transcript_6502/m.26346 type:complete len:344 (-) Transcript_6502:11-1042(-)
MVRAACASSSVPISSTTITSGVWFCTASMSTWCCESGLGTCMRRAAPMPGCGMSPSPPISFEVSTITTRRAMPPDSRETESTRAISRIAVVFPTPGLPRSKTLRPLRNRSKTKSALPSMALPTRAVSPTTLPARLRMTETRCNVSLTPARLSPPTSPTPASAASTSSYVSGSETNCSSPSAKRAMGARPRSSTTSSSASRRGCSRSASRRRGGRSATSLSSSPGSVRLARCAANASAPGTSAARLAEDVALSDVVWDVAETSPRTRRSSAYAESEEGAREGARGGRERDARPRAGGTPEMCATTRPRKLASRAADAADAAGATRCRASVADAADISSVAVRVA